MHKASKDVQIAMKSAKSKWTSYYILKMDVTKYFHNIDKRILWDILKRKIKDKKLLWLTREILLPNKEIANDVLNDITIFLKEKLGLTLNSKTRIFKNKQGVNFCRLQNKRI